MTKSVHVYWSHQSPYCYFALDRLLALNSLPDVDVSLRLVLPGVLRIPGVFADATDIAERYFSLDVGRTAAFLGVPYGAARPNPVEFQSGTLFRAAAAQPRVYRLYYLNASADDLGQSWAFLDVVSRLIWDGTAQNWHTGDALRTTIEQAGLDYSKLVRHADTRIREFDQRFADNHAALMKVGHWGVPTFVYGGEPFFGQDRFDQLLWRMGLNR